MMRWTFLAPSVARPAGGVIALFEIVNALARGGDLVQVVHLPTPQGTVGGLGDVPWMSFDPSVQHHFAAAFDPATLPEAEAVVYTTMVLAAALGPEGGPAGRSLVASLRGPTTGRVSVLFLQGHGVFPPEVERLAAELPGLKVCVGSWLVDLLVSEGAPAADVVHIPNGLDPQTFHVVQPIEHRPAHTAMNFDPYPVKGGEVGLEALVRVQRLHEVDGTVFGTRPPERALPSGLRFVASPRQAEIATTIYNQASVYLQPSRREGFGMCAVEAMACGCALVTTANGGSAEYAFHDETALVCGPSAEEMAEAIGRLVGDDALRLRLATAGAHFVQRFRWTTTAERLRQAVAERLAGDQGSSGTDG